MSISTKTGDGGQTSLPGGSRVSKADPRVETYGTIDELISSLGLARALCTDPTLGDLTKSIQRELFRVSSAVAAPPDARKPAAEVTPEMIQRLTDEIDRLEATENILADWVLPGGDVASAAFDVARTVCRRAERQSVRLIEMDSSIESGVVVYLNRLSDLLWLCGRRIELEKKVDSRLREDGNEKSGRWTRAW